MEKQISVKPLFETPVKHKTLDLVDYQIHYFVSGAENGDLIVFLHPAFSDHRAFDLQVDHFSQNFCVITIDLIGHGLSKANHSKDKIDASAGHICEIIEREGYKAAHIVGVSMGSLVGQHFGLLFPDKTRSLVALGGYNINLKNREVQKAQMLSNLGLLLLAVFSIKWFRKRTAQITTHSERGKAFSYRASSLYERRSFMVMQGFDKIIMNRPNYHPSFPILILTGEFDIKLAHRMSIRWHRNLENSEYTIIENAGHCANLDAPEACNRVITAFLKR